MKQDKSERRVPQPARRSSASAILSGKGNAGPTDNYTTFGWMLLFATFITITAISFLFTPFTHQLDEIKNVLLMFAPPFLLLAALWKMDFSAITWKRGGALIILGLYFLWMCISWAINPYRLVGETVIWFNLGVATFTIILAWYMNTENKLRKTMMFFVGLAFTSTILGLILYAGRYTEGLYMRWANVKPWGTLLYTLMGSHGDMYSFILNSDFYAAFLVMLIPVSISMFFVENRTSYKIYALASFLLMCVCLFLTNSNDSFISIAIAFPIYLILGRRYVREWGMSRQFVWTLIGGMAFLLLLIGLMMLPKLVATFDFKSEAFEGRRVLWGGGFWPWIYGDNVNGESIDLVSIIFGTGPGGYRSYFPWFRRPDFFDQQINNVTTFGHNFYLDTLLETGVVGLVLLIGLHVRVLGDGLRQLRTTTSRTHLFYQLAVMSGIIGIAIQNFSSPNNRWAVAGMTYWCMFGLSIGIASLDRSPVPGDNASKRIGGIPVFKLSHWASLALALVFFVRCVFPGGQFLDYWRGAQINADGLRDMESVYAGMPADQKDLFLQQARDEFKAAIAYNPTFATSYYKLGHIYNQLGESDKAIDTYEELNQINANYSEVHLNLGIMYAQKAGTLPQKARQLKTDADQLLQKMQTASGATREKLKQDYDKANEDLSTLIKTMDQQREVLMTKSYDHMKDAAHQSLKPNTQYLTGTIGRELVSIYDEKGDTKKADQLREEIKKYFWALLMYQPKIEDAGIQADQKEYYPKAQKQLLALAQETNNSAETIEVLKRMVADNPDNPLYLEALLDSYDKANKPKDKIVYLEHAVHADPTDAGLRMQLAAAYKLTGDNKKFVSELRRVEVLAPENPEMLKELYTAYKDEGATSEATAYADKLSSFGIKMSDTATSAAAEVKTTATQEDLTPAVADERATNARVVTLPESTATLKSND